MSKPDPATLVLLTAAAAHAAYRDAHPATPAEADQAARDLEALVKPQPIIKDLF
jgi:hypothetical protein